MGNTVFVVAGGTGGHVFPAIALAEELQKHGVEVQCVTDKRGERYFAQNNITPHVVMSSAWSSTWAGKLKAGLKIGQGIIQSLDILREYSPSCVVGFGGYPSFPTVKAAQFLKIPTVLHEQNAVLGRAHRQLIGPAQILATSFKDTSLIPIPAANKIIVTGNPVRRDFASAAVPFETPKKSGAFHLLVFGGSQGATLFSKILPQAIEMLDPELRARLVVTQQARLEDIDALMLAYNTMSVSARIQPFYNDILELYNHAHLVISRAGASTVAELIALGRPSLIVPLASSLDGDQAQNAANIVAQKAGWMMDEKGFTPEALAARLTEIMKNPALLEETALAAKTLGKPQAAGKLAEVVMKYL